MNHPFNELLHQHADRVKVVSLADRAMHTGRRMGRVRNTMAGSLAVALTAGVVGGYLVLSPSASEVTAENAVQGAAGPFEFDVKPVEALVAPTSCQVEVLPVPGGYDSYMTAMDPTGSIIVGRSYPGDGSRAVLLWRDGAVEEVDVPGSDQALYGVNSAGVAVGGSHMDGQDEGRWQPWIYRDGEVSEIPGLEAGIAYDINENGDIVGTQTVEGMDMPFVLPAGAQKPVMLDLPEGAAGGEADSISQDGYIVGYYIDSQAGAYHPYIWQLDGTGQELRMPAGVDPNSHSYADSISGGWVVGYLDSGEQEPVGIRWNLAEGGEPEILDLNDSGAVNSQGWVAGGYRNDAGTGTPAMLTGDARVDLPTLTESSYLSNTARAISEDGKTLAGASSPDAGNTAVYWTCE